MKFSISNNSDLDMEQMRPLLKSFVPFAQKKMGYDRPVRINFTSDSQNADNPLGKTAFYDPNVSEVTIFTDQRHPKDIYALSRTNWFTIHKIVVEILIKNQN